MKEAERTNCLLCAVTILSVTADDYDGFCATCFKRMNEQKPESTASPEHHAIRISLLFTIFLMMFFVDGCWKFKVYYCPSEQVEKEAKIAIRKIDFSKTDFVPVPPRRFINNAGPIWNQKRKYDLERSFTYRTSFLYLVVFPACVAGALLYRKELWNFMQDKA